MSEYPTCPMHDGKPSSQKYCLFTELRIERDQLQAALREVVNTLGPNYFGGELEGLLNEGGEALRVAQKALA